ncbi:MAG TPA: flagellar biosynthesis protein FlhB [Steroidobacteraceae bacterium]|jgi:flagellar biosynthetic protein FlhB|nr:flagellar biosynthesis protein FlhB [Steroidobacteraceae bacterium]
MAENESAGQRTEQPTAKRLEQARERGQVARSADLNAAAVLLASAGGLSLLGGWCGTRLYGLMQSGLSFSRERALDENAALAVFGVAGKQAFFACAPFFGITVLAALAAPLALGGRGFHPQALVPDFSRLSPGAGFARMFSLSGGVELVKAFAKFLLLALIAAAVLWQQSGAILSLGAQSAPAAIAHAGSLAGSALLLLAAGMALIAAVDVPWQLWRYKQNLLMTREEVREEMKDSEGSPEIKGRIRKLQNERARRRMMREVPKADVVVVNPTHFAVALRYDEQRMRAPLVVAKGQDLMAARIREIAAEHTVPIFEAPPLARALHRHVEIGAEIPAVLYVAVAQVLTYLAQLRAARETGKLPPPPPTIDVALDPDAKVH